MSSSRISRAGATVRSARAGWSRSQPIAALPAKFAQATETLCARSKSWTKRGERLQRSRRGARDSAPLSLFRGQPDRRRMFSRMPFLDRRGLDQRSRDRGRAVDRSLARHLRLRREPRRRRLARSLRDSADCKMARCRCPRSCGTASMLKMPLTGPAMVGLAHMAFQEVKAAFRERMRDRAGRRRNGNSRADDCHFVRQKFRVREVRRIHLSLGRSADRGQVGRKRSRAANINGSWRNCIRRSRCFITAFTGVVRTKRRWAARWPAQPTAAQFSFRLFRGGFHRALPPCGCSMPCRS